MGSDIMASNAAKTAATDDEVNRLFEGIGDDGAVNPEGAVIPPQASGASQVEEDLLAELENLGVQQRGERPHTPRVQAIAASSKRTSTTPPPATPARSSEDKVSTRKSADSARSLHASFSPSATSSELHEPEKKVPALPAPQPTVLAGGGWWGGILATATATATAAVKTAEAAVKEIQQNEEAKKWAEQVKGNMGALKGLGGELSSRALPTFTNILHTLAPPISSHERLLIHITHDFVGYPSLDPLIYSTFSRVMAQVEGGDLMVIQRGQESIARRNSDVSHKGSNSGWDDGPWWREAKDHRDIGVVKGLVEGTKLVRASAEAYSTEFFASNGGIELAIQRATENLSETNPVRSSDIFLAIQAVSHEAPANLFQGAAKDTSSEVVAEEKAKPDGLISFAIYLYDPIHAISFHTLSQSVPSKWIGWLDAPPAMKAASPGSPRTQTSRGGAFFNRDNEGYVSQQLPEEIAEIIEAGGIDPREWVAEWVQEVLGLGVGVVAQRYVARRMGVGEGGIGKGKARADEVLGDGGGEAARAGI